MYRTKKMWISIYASIEKKGALLSRLDIQSTKNSFLSNLKTCCCLLLLIFNFISSQCCFLLFCLLLLLLLLLLLFCFLFLLFLLLLLLLLFFLFILPINSVTLASLLVAWQTNQILHFVADSNQVLYFARCGVFRFGCVIKSWWCGESSPCLHTDTQTHTHTDISCQVDGLVREGWEFISTQWNHMTSHRFKDAQRCTTSNRSTIHVQVTTVNI